MASPILRPDIFCATNGEICFKPSKFTDFIAVAPKAKFAKNSVRYVVFFIC